ncbi:unnamed protein product [Penicillium salamii]|uniref:Metallo-beta-lactamase domain-containing protein n=1 Tax=Penicillium salamii TaxID=1612424 RepID=A0A9W4JS13_9EURO|nr:unnamed protein product [Penicillium salamii]CAG7960352.1 unnamed protein product [Penicillium salamii]CAG8272449.1 unnamed protein product [Penicillium salamii]CAG8385004.1 unnamed protein product [Penicillium salamii]CAG8396740.1 unnamed protein product [Penicillium salamii]
MLRPLQHPIIASRRIVSNACRVSATYAQSSTLTYGGQSRYIHQSARGSGLINARLPRSNITIKKGAKQNMTAPIKQHSTTTASTEPAVHDVFDTTSGTWQYIVADPSTSTAVIIDPVLNFDPATQAITTKSADALLALVKDKNYKIDKILETHAHADHLSAASYLQSRLLQSQDHKPPICIGKRIEQVQKLFSQRYGVPKSEYKQVFDRLLDDDETFTIGNITAKAIHLPGHTPDHLGYMIGDNVFCGDSLFHADIGTARCDFPGGDAKDLFQSGRKLLSLPGHVKIWTGHDYPPAGREPMPWLSVQDHRELNKHLKDGVNEDTFVALRQERDAGLAAPRLLHQSLQINIRAGRLPAPTEAGQRLLHVPLKIEDAW